MDCWSLDLNLLASLQNAKFYLYNGVLMSVIGDSGLRVGTAPQYDKKCVNFAQGLEIS